MIGLRCVISNEAPSGKNIIWAKPVTGGFTLYLMEAGIWKPVKMVDDNNTASTSDDVVQDVIGSVQDESTANTINGAKAYADAGDALIIGTADDTESDLTLYGLKAKIEALGG